MKKIIKQILLISSIFMFLLALNGCGQKGPLYLPKKDQTQTKTQTTNSWYAGGGLGLQSST
jgi:predicted small lipoprotein YifL